MRESKDKPMHHYKKGAKDLEELKLGDVFEIFFPIGNGAKDPIKNVAQSKVSKRAYELLT